MAFSSNGADGTITVVRAVSPTEFNVVDNVTTARGADWWIPAAADLEVARLL